MNIRTVFWGVFFLLLILTLVNTIMFFFSEQIIQEEVSKLPLSHPYRYAAFLIHIPIVLITIFIYIILHLLDRTEPKLGDHRDLFGYLTSFVMVIYALIPLSNPMGFIIGEIVTTAFVLMFILYALFIDRSILTLKIPKTSTSTTSPSTSTSTTSSTSTTLPQ